MAIVPDSEILAFFDTIADYFEINSANDALYFKYDAGTSTLCDIADGTYSGVGLANAIANAINTAFSITSTATWNSSTSKFTIAVAAGHTIQYINNGSEGGLTCGFSEDSTASLSITSDQVAQGSSPTAMILNFRDYIEDSVEKYCRRTFESTSYTRERYDGTGNHELFLKQMPVTALDRLAIGTRDVVKIRNTNTSTSASVSVTGTGIRLVYNGTADTTVLFSTYTTLNTVVAAINLISGWSASVPSASTYGGYKSTDLLPAWGLSCIDNQDIYLKIPEEAEDDFFDLDEEAGIISSELKFSKGFQNVFVDYTAGYSSSNMPTDLKLGIKIATKAYYQKWKEERWDVKKLNITDSISVEFNEKDFPNEALMRIGKYRRRLV